MPINCFSFGFCEKRKTLCSLRDRKFFFKRGEYFRSFSLSFRDFEIFASRRKREKKKKKNIKKKNFFVRKKKFDFFVERAK